MQKSKEKKCVKDHFCSFPDLELPGTHMKKIEYFRAKFLRKTCRYKCYGRKTYYHIMPTMDNQTIICTKLNKFSISGANMADPI